VGHRVLDASECYSVGDVARGSHYEDVPQTLIEDQLRADAAVGTREDNRFGRLSGGQFVAKRSEIACLRLAGNESTIASHEAIPDFVRRGRFVAGRVRGVQYRSSLRLLRNSGSGERYQGAKTKCAPRREFLKTCHESISLSS
jgi:hypothetical protein